MGKSGKILEIGAVVDVDRLAEDAVPLSKKTLAYRVCSHTLLGG